MWAKIGRTLPYVILYIAAAAIVGLYNVLTVRENPDVLSDPTFWNRVISQNIANMLVLVATIGLFIKKYMNDDDFVNMATLVGNAVLTDLDSGFGVWVFDSNKITKMNAFRAKVQGKINKGELRASAKALETWYYGTDEQRRKSHYCRVRKRLEESISEERLNRYILAIKVDYDEIDRAFIETGETRRVTKKNQKQASTWLIIQDNWTRFAFSIAGAAFFNAFIYDTNVMSAAFWAQVAFNVMMLVSMFISGMSYAKTYKQEVLMGDLNTRYNIIKDYLTHKVSKLKEAK